MSSFMESRPGKRDLGIVLIAVFKLLKALLLVAIGFGAIGLMHTGVASLSERLLHTFSAGTERRVTLSLLSRVSGMSPKRFEALGIGAFLYAALFAVEAVGLWMQRRWAEYLTVIATASFIPFEIYELVRQVTVPRVIALAVNVIVVIYLIVRLRRPRR